MRISKPKVNTSHKSHKRSLWNTHPKYKKTYIKTHHCEFIKSNEENVTGC